MFGMARYQVGNSSGSSVTLTIDYENNRFDLSQDGSTADKAFLLEVKRVAQDLLQRKHGVNFAERVQL